MHLRIILEHFQNNTYSDLIFDSGLTIIKGTNNQGKSTLRRALQAVIFNNPRKTKNYIQSGEKYCSVTIEVEGYKQIIWKKTKNEVTYIIDGVPTNKAGRLTLFDVYPDNPFTVFDTNLVNIIAQKERPLPFNQTSSQTFQMFEELYGILSTKEDIGKFNNQLSTYNTQIVSNTAELNRLNTKKSCALTYKKSVDTDKLIKLRDKLVNYSNFLKQIEAIKKINEHLQNKQDISIPIQPTELDSIIAELKKIKSIKDTYNLQQELKSITKPIEVTLFKSLDKLSKVLEIKKSLLQVNKINRPVSLELFEEYNSLLKIINLANTMDKLNTKRTDTLNQIENIKKVLPVCPTCNRPF